MTANQAQKETPTLETALDQVKELNEQFRKNARQAGNLYLESYEWTVDRAIDFEHRVAELSQQEWLKDVIKAQSEFAREFSASYTSAVRSFLK